MRIPLLVALLATASAGPCAADDTPVPSSPPPATLDATVKLTGGIVAAGVGYKWGHGTLTYQGQQFRFCVRGLSVGDVGAASLDARGNVDNLKAPEDFVGKYFALSGGFAIGRSAPLPTQPPGAVNPSGTVPLDARGGTLIENAIRVQLQIFF